jgi:hypothetical protein
VREYTIELVRHDWDRFDDLLDLSYAVLYEPFGVEREGDWYHPANGSDFAVALDVDGGLVGTARLLPLAADGTRQVRQVAVIPELGRQGSGRRSCGRSRESRSPAAPAGCGFTPGTTRSASTNGWGMYPRGRSS